MRSHFARTVSDDSHIPSTHPSQPAHLLAIANDELRLRVDREESPPVELNPIRRSYAQDGGVCCNCIDTFVLA